MPLADSPCPPPGHHRRREQECAAPGRRGPWEVQGGRAENEEAVRDARGGEAGQLLLLQLLEGEGPPTGLDVPQY